MKCPSCNEELPADVAFCPNCGTPVAKPAPAAAAPAATRTFSGLETVAYRQAERAAATPALEPGATFAGRYRIERKIGEGGMGVVYAARDGNTDEEIVLKLIHPGLVAGEEAMARLVAEGVTARRIRHPNIVAVYDVGQADGQPFLTMEYVQGGTLRSWLVNAISSGQETGLNTAVGVVRSILAGLGEAHRMGFVHRDLKPENILLGGDPGQGDFSLKILDFGIAKAIGTATANRSGGATGGVGTPLYMAPEQRTAPDTVGPPADLYSVSAILYELLMEAAPQGRWEFPSEHRADVPKQLDKVIERGLAMRARTRFQSVAEYQAALDEALGVAPAPDAAGKPDRAERQSPPPGGETKPPPPEKPPPTAAEAAAKKKKIWLWGAIAAAVLVVGAIGNLMENRPSPPPEKPQRPLTPEPPPPPEPPRRNQAVLTEEPARNVPNASGVWYDDAGNPFQITQDGTRIGGSGFAQGVPIRIDGSLSGSGLSFQAVNSMTGQTIFRGDGYVLDPRHLSYSLYAANGGLVNRGCFHLNHMPSPPCVNGRF